MTEEVSTHVTRSMLDAAAEAIADVVDAASDEGGGSRGPLGDEPDEGAGA